MDIILLDGNPLTLTETQVANTEFQRGLQMAIRENRGPSMSDNFTEAAWIGNWTGFGMHCNRSATEVRKALGE